ncbi:luciferase [Mangrovactinospora gilvigrisea]|uniref:Luciferase n=1 Tax=Mangrovactinospora gilvigrisea TaxID=1428644 RepID=A0A1J7CFK5_9ACTN|nr:LLM class flavin-dependent oxidoreductase [Mangrovactinospora gilvigrisea]OIV38474.1 luciferase [Mangrovactinospora gilvigrisea]
MDLSTVILPIYRWRTEGRAVWQRAEALGLHAGYTYDHLSWRGEFREGPWFGAVPTLAAAAEATGRLRLGTMVTSPNFRHPVTLAKELMSLDDVSGGRVTIGIGAGTADGADATALGQQPWSPRERADRFAEFTALLDELLTHPATTHGGAHYSAHEARMIPGCVQRPRLPLTVAGNGPRGMRVAARLGQGWVTTGGDPRTGERGPKAVAGQLERLAEACGKEGRDPATLRTVLLAGFTDDPFLASPAAFAEHAAAYREIGIDELVLHWPVPGTRFDGDQGVFERAVTEWTSGRQA